MNEQQNTGVSAYDTSQLGAEEAAPGFTVHLDNFEGPFDLLLQLISKHQLDVTEVALARVTDEFIEHIRAMGPEWDLDQTTEFVLVAATLLDLKAARLLPKGEVEDEEDLALLEARDLLFARLLQYRAYKQIAGLLSERVASEDRRYPRTVGLDERFCGLLPEVLLGMGPNQFAQLAAKALTPKPEPEVGLGHLHAPRVSVREQAGVLVERLRRSGWATFRSLTSDSPGVVTTVARFLALLELYREGAVAFEQAAPLAELTIRWSGSEEGEVQIGEEFDEPETSQVPDPADDEETGPDGATDRAGSRADEDVSETTDVPSGEVGRPGGEASFAAERDDLDTSDERENVVAPGSDAPSEMAAGRQDGPHPPGQVQQTKGVAP